MVEDDVQVRVFFLDTHVSVITAKVASPCLSLNSLVPRKGLMANPSTNTESIIIKKNNPHEVLSPAPEAQGQLGKVGPHKCNHCEYSSC